MYIRNEESVSTTEKRFRNFSSWSFEDLNLTDAKELDRNNLNKLSYSLSNFIVSNTRVCYFFSLETGL